VIAPDVSDRHSAVSSGATPHRLRCARYPGRRRYGPLVTLALAVQLSFATPAPLAASGEVYGETPGARIRATTLGGEPILPVPRGHAGDPARAALGERLYYDPRLSATGETSCASCHDLAHGGDDGKQTSLRMDGSATPVNTPTIFNAALNRHVLWDGRVLNLREELELGVAAGIDWDGLPRRLSADAGYRLDFARLYRDGITVSNIRDVLEHFERTLVTPDAPFDRWLRGEPDALGADARAGYRLFKSYGCVSCHQGVNVGGNLYQKIGVMHDYFAERKTPLTAADLGRYNHTGREQDRHVFRVPSLRNVALTAPYFHDGSVSTLDQAVVMMGRYQLGRDIPPADVARIEAFLTSLSGEYLGKQLAEIPEP
jgi:cytochrome c peroxidase